MRVLFCIILFFIHSHALKPIALQFTGVKVEHSFSNGEKESYLIKREVHKNCKNIQISSENFSKDNIEKNIKEECKKTLITSRGVIQPMYINKDIKTYAELEVLYFIYKKTQESKKKQEDYILVDSRRASWFDLKTIPSAVNIPFEDLDYDEDFEEEFYSAYEKLGVKVKDKNTFDFTNAKTAVFFCNGAWCPLSSNSIEYLQSISYPKDKLIWYRGGLASWEALSLSVTKKLE